MKKNGTLEFTVFGAGAVVMIFEMVGSRVLAPTLGTSIVIWTSLIGVILGSMSLGYFLGGKFADMNATLEKFALLLFIAALCVGTMAATKDLMLAFFQTLPLGLKGGSLLASVVLFAPTSVFLGMVTPYAVKLKMHTLASSGSTVGTLYAISTVGSIAGTFFAGFWLMPVLGNSHILVVLSAMLVVLSLVVFFERWRQARVLTLVILISMMGIHQWQVARAEAAGVIDRDTTYNRVRIYDEKDARTGMTVRRLSVGNELSSAMLIENDDLVYRYTKFYRLARHFTPTITHALMFGGGAYSYPKDFLKQFTSATLDVVEIDPAITALAKQYFRLKDDPRLAIFHEDGRVFLNETKNKYDVIFGDAFHSRYSVPYQLCTQEAVGEMYRALNDSGVAMVNLISAIEGSQSEFLRAELATYKKVFPQVYLFPVNAPRDGHAVQNVMLVALKSTVPTSFVSQDFELNSYLAQRWVKDVPADLPVLTDELAPVDYYIQKLL